MYLHVDRMKNGMDVNVFVRQGIERVFTIYVRENAELANKETIKDIVNVN